MRFTKRKSWAIRSISLLLVAVIFFAFIPANISAVANTNTQQGFIAIPMVAAGSNHTVALSSDGLVWTWGANRDGQQGNGTFSPAGMYRPAQVQNLYNVIAVAAGSFHNVALTNVGTVWTWGNNIYGSLGDGTTTGRATPVQVPNLNNIVAIDANGYFTVALSSNGTVWYWGLMGSSRIDGPTFHTTPRQLQGMNNVVAISAAIGVGADDADIIMLRDDSSVWQLNYSMWGNTAEQRQQLSDISTVAAGTHFTLALNDIDGTIWAWGTERYGQLGSGASQNLQMTPRQVLNFDIMRYYDGVVPLDDIVAISAGWRHSLALREDGTVWTWGSNSRGQLGIGEMGGIRNMPSHIYGLHNVVAISAGGHHSVVIRDDGAVLAWGSNFHGELGIDSYENESSRPMQVVGADGIGYLNLGTSRGEGYFIEAFINRPSPIFNVGETFTISYVLWNHSPDAAETQPWEWKWDAVSIIISNDSVVSADPVILDEGVRRMEKSLLITALSVGTSSITIIDINNGAELTIDIEVVDIFSVPNSFRMGYIPTFYAFENQWWVRQIQTNFHFNGLYVNSFSHTRTSGGYNVSFNVYNSRHMHGAVDVYDRYGNWVDSHRIDKFTNITGLWETGEAAWDLIRNTFTGAALCYTAESYSQRTRISIFVPEGGHFTISNNFANSPGTMLYNAVDFIIIGASSTISLVAGSFSADTVAKNFVDNLLSVEKFAEEFLKKYAQIAMEAQVASFWDIPETLSEQVIGIMDFSGIDWRMALGVAVGVGENAFMLAAGPAGIGLRAIFGINRAGDLTLQISQLRASRNAAVFTIFTPEQRGSFMVQGVTAIPSDGAIDEDAVLQVFRVVYYDRTLDWFPMNYRYELFNISFVRNGNERIQPNGLVTVKLPIPENFNRDTIRVHHDSGTGVWRILDARIEGNHIVFETDIFSLFAIVEAPSISVSHGTDTTYSDSIESPENNTERGWWIFAIAGVGTLLLIVVVVIIVKSKNHHNRRR